MANILYLSTLLVMGLSTFNGLFIISEFFYKSYVKWIQSSLYYAHVTTLVPHALKLECNVKWDDLGLSTNERF